MPNTNVSITLPRLLLNQAERIPDKTLVGFRDEPTLTYASLAAAASSGGARLADYGLHPGNMAALYLGNSTSYVRAWFSCLFAGVVDVPINPEFRKTTLEFALRTMDARAIFTDGEGLEHITAPEVVERTSALSVIVLCGDVDITIAEAQLAALPQRPPVILLDDLLSHGATSTAWEELRSDAACSIRMTSGTTGPAKGVVLIHEHLVARTARHNEIMQMGGDDTLYSPFPFHHTLASINGLISTLQAGATMWGAKRFSASRYFKDATDFGATRGHMIASVSKFVHMQPPGPYDRTHNIEYLWSGLPNSAFEERFGAKFVQMFGMSEIGCLAYKRGGPDGHKGLGTPVPDIDVRIHDSFDHPVPVGEVGEIVARPKISNRMFLGYLNNAPATMRALRNLWYHTGDAGYLGEDGQLYFLGRMGDTIRRRGVNISSEMLDSEIRKSDLVHDCAVIGVPSETGEQDIHACIAFREGVDVRSDLDRLFETLIDRLPKEYVPRYIEPMQEFPRTSTGKIKKAALREREAFGEFWDRDKNTWIGGPTADTVGQPGRSADA